MNKKKITMVSLLTATFVIVGISAYYLCFTIFSKRLTANVQKNTIQNYESSSESLDSKNIVSTDKMIDTIKIVKEYTGDLDNDGNIEKLILGYDTFNKQTFPGEEPEEITILFYRYIDNKEKLLFDSRKADGWE